MLNELQLGVKDLQGAVLVEWDESSRWINAIAAAVVACNPDYQPELWLHSRRVRLT